MHMDVRYARGGLRPPPAPPVLLLKRVGKRNMEMKRVVTSQFSKNCMAPKREHHFWISMIPKWPLYDPNMAPRRLQHGLPEPRKWCSCGSAVRFLLNWLVIPFSSPCFVSPTRLSKICTAPKRDHHLLAFWFPFLPKISGWPMRHCRKAIAFCFLTFS